MKRCLACNTPFDASAWSCPECDFAPAQIEGIKAFAPSLAERTSGFRSQHFEQLAALEENSFWFTARNRLIVRALAQWTPNAKSMLEIGCGTGYVLQAIGMAFPGIELSGTEILVAGLPYAAKRVPQATLMQMDARSIPFDREFDAVGAFDVLEHIEEDDAVMREVWRALRPGGAFLVTVPQHRFLWSKQDEYACHVRRYEAEELRAQLLRTGFKLKYWTSFVTLLLPLLYLSRLRKRSERKFDATDEMRISSFANSLLGGVMRLEDALIAAGLRLPAGGSLLAVATKE